MTELRERDLIIEVLVSDCYVVEVFAINEQDAIDTAKSLHETNMEYKEIPNPTFTIGKTTKMTEKTKSWRKKLGLDDKWPIK